MALSYLKGNLPQGESFGEIPERLIVNYMHVWAVH